MKERSHDNAQVVGFSPWKDRVVIYCDGKKYKERRLGDRESQYQELSFRHAKLEMVFDYPSGSIKQAVGNDIHRER